MTCGCGRSYIVNENNGFSNKRKKDTSFRSFITFLLVVLLVCIAIYCVILTIDQRKRKNLQSSNASKENLHGDIEHQSSTENSSISIENITSPTRSDQTDNTATSLLQNDFSKLTEEYVTSTLKQMETTPKSIHIIELLLPDSETSETDPEIKIQDYNDITTQKTHFNTVTELTYKQNTDIVDSDSTTKFNEPLINDLVIISGATTNKQYLATNSEISTEVNILKNKTTGEKIEINNNIFMTDVESTTKSYKIESTKDVNENIGDISKLGTKKSYFISASTRNNVLYTTESKIDFINSLEVVTKDSNKLLSNNGSSDTTEKSNKETTTIEIEISEQVTNDEVKREFLQIRPRYYNRRIVEESTTKSNDKETMVTMRKEELPNEPTTYHPIKLQQTTFPDIDTEVSNNILDVTTNRIKEKKGFEAETLQNELTKPNLTVTTNENVCTEPSCKEKAGQILQLMDHSCDPCENFYQFSCGGVQNSNEKYTDILLKHVYTFLDTKDKYLKSFRKFFYSCIKFETEYQYSTRIKQVLSSNVRDSNLTSLLSFLMLRQSTPLFEVQYGFVGGKEGYGMQILPPNSNYETTGLKDWSLQNKIEKQCLNFDPKLKYESEVNLPRVYENYTKCKEATFKRMAENFVIEKQSVIHSRKSILRDFLSFFSKINKVSGPTLQYAILNQLYTKTNIELLSQTYPQIDWQDFLKIITGEAFETSTPIFLYMEQEYFKPIMSDLRERLLKTEKEVIESLKLYYQLELYQNLLAPKRNKEEFCINQAIELMPEIATKILYETSGFENFRFSEIKETFLELKDKFYWMIDVSELEEANKKTYKNNLETLTLKLFDDNEEWRKYLEESYDSIYLMDDYLSNMFMFIENKRKSRNALRSDENGFIFTQFVDSQLQSTPKLIPGTNVIAIPNKFLDKVLTAQGFPPYLVTSYLKFHLTRALALHFNDVDQKLKSPFYRQFLNSLNSYVENGDDIKMIKDQRISYKMKSFWREIVQFSEAPRLANNMALDMAFQNIFITDSSFDSLPWISKEYSPQQQFFIFIAQEYCENPTVPALAQHLYESVNIPSTFLVENMIMNSKEFSETFECPQGTPMNPEEKSQFENFIFIENNYYDQINK